MPHQLLRVIPSVAAETDPPAPLPPEPETTGGKGTQKAIPASAKSTEPPSSKTGGGLASSDRLTADVEGLVESGTPGSGRWMLVIVREIRQQVQEVRADLQAARAEAGDWRSQFHKTDKERAVLERDSQHTSLREFFVGLGGILAGFSAPYLISGTEKWLAGVGVVVGLVVMYRSVVPPKARR